MSQSFLNAFALGVLGGASGVICFLALWRALERRAQAKRKAEWNAMIRRRFDG